MKKLLLAALLVASYSHGMQRTLTNAERLSDLKLMLPKETNPANKVKIEEEIRKLEYLMKIYIHGQSYCSRDHYMHDGLFGDDF